MAATKKRRLTDEEREERREKERQLAADAVEALRTSEGWQQWLRTRSRFHKYSFGNQLLIAIQGDRMVRKGWVEHPPTRVAGFRKWLELGYCVRKRPEDVPEGAWGIKIWAPVPPSKAKIAEAIAAGEKPDKLRMFFRLAAVFGDNQVAPLPEEQLRPGLPVPLDPPIADLEGDSLEAAWRPLCELVVSRHSIVMVTPIADKHTHGWLDLHTLDITIGEDLSMNGRVKTLIHETSHLLLRVDPAVKELGRVLDRAEEELIVESVAMSVCGTLGLDTSQYSIPYLTSWSETTDIDVLEGVAKLVNKLACTIEDALPVELVGVEA